MTRYRMDDGSIVDTDDATKRYEQGIYHDGNAKATGDQWQHQDLYRSSRDRYYMYSSQWRGSRDSAEWARPN
jgi:hypothetical protein